MHDSRQPRRTGHTPLTRVPLKPHDTAHQRLLLAAGVGLSALVIFGLYAASFRYQNELNDDVSQLPRWAVLRDDIGTALTPLEKQTQAISNVKETMAATVGAKVMQAEATAILKEKITSATPTPETK